MAIAWLWLAATLSSVSASAATRDHDHIFWSGKSDGFQIQWSHADLIVYATRGSPRLRFSAREFARRGLSRFIAATKDPHSGRPLDCDYRREFRPVSIVGSLISFTDTYVSTCRKEAHPGGEQRYTTIDVSKPGAVAYGGPDSFGIVEEAPTGKAVVLTSLFPAEDIYRALLANGRIADILESDGAAKAPATLDALVEDLSGRIGPADLCFSIPADLLSRFVFDRVEGDKVVVALGLPGTALCRDNLTSIELFLPIPSQLGDALARAATKTVGFLAKSAEETIGEGATVFSARSGRGGL